MYTSSTTSRPRLPTPSRATRTPVLAVLAGVLAAVLFPLLAAPAQADSAPAQGAGSWVRAAHLVPGLGTMTIGLTRFAGEAGDPAPSDGASTAPREMGMRVLAPAAAYGAVTDYQQIPTGFYTVTVRPAGDADGAPLISGTLEAKPGQAYTLAGLGTKDNPRLATLDDDLTPPDQGESRVRLLPAASAAETVTVTAQDGPTVASQAPFGQATGYAAVPAGSWTLDAVADMDATTEATTEVDLAAGSVYTLLVLDSDDGLTVTPVVDAAGMDVMPQGGAQTGGGGLAAGTGDQRAEVAAAVAATAGVLLLGGLVLVAVRSSRRPEPVGGTER